MTVRSFVTSFAVASLVPAALVAPAAAQVSHGGVPPSQWAELTLPVEVLKLPEMPPAPPVSQLLAPKAGEPLRYGEVVQVGLSADEFGTWEELRSGDLVWRVEIESSGALSLSCVFSSFIVPPGGELFVHAAGDPRTLGAYTSLEANPDGSFAFEPLEGESIVLEYLEPASAPFHATIELGSVIHDYLGVLDVMGVGSPIGQRAAGSCEVDVNCSEGTSYQDEKRAVVRLLSGGALCTGSMINNTANNARRFMITAFHCGSMNNAILYFNYERPNCGSGSPATQTVQGTTQRASNKKYDFRLTEVNPTIPTTYNHYFLGWDRSGVAPASTVCIHHPAGDVKKISFDNNAPVKNSTRWQILNWEQTANGWGVTEGGSSGSPLMSQGATARFIGQLWGGASYCGYPYNDYYGRFDQAWSYVKSYLDPGNTNATTCNGYDP